MKNRSLKIVGVFFLLAAVFLMVSVKKTPETKTTNEVREVVKAKRSRINKPLQEIVTVEYSTRAFLKKGTPETKQQ